jgi:hypothetical protein
VSGPAGFPRLPAHLARYRDRRPSRQQRRREGIDGSQMELEIVSLLVREGLRDGEIARYFDRNRLPRYLEEGRSRSWLASLVKTARENQGRHLASSPPEAGTAAGSRETERVIGIQHTPPPERTYASAALPFLVLRARAEGGPESLPLLGGWYREIVEVSRRLPAGPVGLSTARDLAGRLRQRGYVATERLPGNRQRVRLTEKGRAAARPVLGRWSRFVPVGYAGRAGPPGAGGPPEDVPEAPAPRPPASGRRQPEPPDPGRGRRQRVVRERRHERLNGWYRLSFRGNRIRHFQLLTPPEQWLGTAAWENLLTGIDPDGLPLFAWVAAEEHDDPVRPLVPDGWRPYECAFALALEFEKEKAGFRVSRFQTPGGEQPRLGVIEQSSSNFFQPLARVEWEGKIIRAKGVGSKLQRRYEFEPVADAPDLETDLSLPEVLASLEQDRHRDLLAALPKGWFHMPLKRKQLVAQLLGSQTTERTTDVAGRLTPPPG